jgi:hypothetical protein
MSDQDNIWYRLGYTLERARRRTSAAPRLRSLGERERGRSGERSERDEPRAARKVGEARRPRPGPTREPRSRDREIRERDEGADRPDAREGAAEPAGGLAEFLRSASPTGEPWEDVISAVGAAVVGRLLDALPRKRRLGPIRLLHAAAAGAGAALVRELLRPVVSGAAADRPLAERARGAAITGSARGLLYGALVEPRLPGPPLVRGAVYGLVEHLVSPMGGLLTLAGPRAPHRSLPFVSALFEELEQADDTLLEHILFGVGLAALYGARPADAEEDDAEDQDDE